MTDILKDAANQLLIYLLPILLITIAGLIGKAIKMWIDGIHDVRIKLFAQWAVRAAKQKFDTGDKNQDNKDRYEWVAQQLAKKFKLNPAEVELWIEGAVHQVFKDFDGVVDVPAPMTQAEMDANQTALKAQASAKEALENLQVKLQETANLSVPPGTVTVVDVHGNPVQVPAGVSLGG